MSSCRLNDCTVVQRHFTVPLEDDVFQGMAKLAYQTPHVACAPWIATRGQEAVHARSDGIPVATLGSALIASTSCHGFPI